MATTALGLRYLAGLAFACATSVAAAQTTPCDRWVVADDGRVLATEASPVLRHLARLRNPPVPATDLTGGQIATA